VPEAAETLGLNLNTAYSRLRLARRDLRAALEEQRRADGTGARGDDDDGRSR